MKALPLMSLHLTSSPYGSKWAASDCSVVSKERPWTKSSVLPACSPESASSASAGALASSAAGLESDPESESEPEEDDAAAFFFGAAFLAGAASDESESEPEEEDAAFLAGAAFPFLTGLASLESESDPLEEDAAFLAGAFLVALALMTGTDESESESSELLSFFCFFGAAFLPLADDALLAALAALLALTFDAALALLVITGLAEESEESLSESLLLLTGFLATFLAGLTSLALDAAFLALFFESSRLCFLDGGSDELALTGFLSFFYSI